MARISPALEKARKEIVEEVIKDIENGTPLFWQNPVLGCEPDCNGLTGKPYRGVNRIHLFFATLRHMKATGKPYGDYRWMTFKQIKDKGYKLNKGAKGALIEYYDKQKIDINDYLNYLEEHKASKELIATVKNLMAKGYDKISIPYTKAYVVFNGEDIDGLPSRQKENKTVEEKHRDMENMLQNSEAKIEYVDPVQGFANHFTPKEDKVVLAKKEYFKDTASFYAVAAHEIAHSTGIKDRLNFPGVAEINVFDEEQYAKEELRAEITSMFIGQQYGFEVDKDHVEQHKAYLQGWAKALKNNPNELWKAATDAEKTVEYIHEHMIFPCQELLKFKDLRQALNEYAAAAAVDEKHSLMNNIDAIVVSQNNTVLKMNDQKIEEVTINDKIFRSIDETGHFGYTYETVKPEAEQKQGKTLTNHEIKEQSKPKAKLIPKVKSSNYQGLHR